MALNVADIREKLFKKIPENKRIPVLAAGGGCVFLILLLIIITASGNRGSVNRSGQSRAGENTVIVSGPRIPGEDLFYPAEPDFLPGLLLEREPQQPWTAEDAEPFWRDPAEPVDFWQEKMSETIDKLMESVP